MPTCPSWDADAKGIATRAASGKVINAITPKMPELWGGSADLAESNNTTPEGEPSLRPTDRQSKMFPGHPYGRVLHFGIREHAMGAILNGIALHGGTRPYGGTFLTFSDYMRPAVRLAALMRLPVIYVWTHDSIGLGEDGPTHQPIEHLAALRAIPGPGRRPPRPTPTRPRPAGRDAARTPTARPACPDPAGTCRSSRAARTASPTPPAWPRAATSCATATATRRDPDRHRLGGAVRGRGAADARRRGHLGPGGLDALPGVVRRAGPGLPRLGHPARGQGPGQGRGRGGQRLAGHRRRRRADRQHRPLRRQRRANALRRVRLQRRDGRRGRQGPAAVEPAVAPTHPAAAGPKAPADLEPDPGASISAHS